MFGRSRYIFLLFLVTALAWAQTDRGSIRGTLTDSSGGVVPGAAITATNIATGAVTPTTSTATGDYNIPSLLVGTYRVEVQAAGFKKSVRDAVVVPLGGVVGLNLALEVGTATQTVIVTGAAPILQTETSSVATTVEPNAYIDLPLSAGGGRNASAFVNLVPGVEGGNPSINGGQTFGNEIQVDGIANETIELFGDPRNILFPPEFVEELSVLTSSYSAEYGDTNSGVVRYAIKSGTNQYHGQAFEYLKNTAFDARGAVNATAAVDHENEYGFTLGGPISIPKLYNGKNKSFFFFGADYYRQHGQGSIGTVSLPNAAFRGGDLSQLLTQNGRQIYYPATTTVNGVTTRQPIPGDIIPSSLISPAALKILSYVPVPQTNGIVNNAFLPRQLSQTYLNEYAIKGDHYFNDKNHLMVSETHGSEPDVNSTVLPFPIQEIFLDTNQIVTLARVGYDHIFSPTVINQLRLGFNRQYALFDPRDIGANYPEKLGIPGFEQSSGSFPSIGWGEFTGLASNHFSEHPVVSDSYFLDDTVSWTKNKHNLKFGADLRQHRHSSYVINQPGINFSSNETADPNNLQNTGDAYASFLLGQVDNANLPLNKANPLVHFNDMQFFIQDDYKVTSRLTVNVGVRGGFMTPYVDSNNEYSIVDLKTPNPAAGNLPGTYIFAGRNGNGSELSYANSLARVLDPRIGLAWRTTDRFVIRAGYGITSVPTGAYGAGHNVALDEGYTATPSVNSLNQGLTPAFILDQGFPQSAIQQPPFISPSLDLGQNISYWSPSTGRLASSQSWNFSTETQLMNNLTLNVSYVGQKGTHLALNTNLNQLNPSYLSLGSLLNDSITNPAVVARGYTAPFPSFVTLYGAGATLGQALRPYPQYLNMQSISSDTTGDSTYHALQVSVNKRLSNGLYLLANYTWSKNISDADISIAPFASTVRDQYNRSLDKVVSSNWVPHHANIAFTYALPIGRGRAFLNSGLLSRIAGGWQLSGILTYRTGDLIGLGVSNTLPLFAGPQTPNTVLGQPLAIQNGPIVIAANGSAGTKYLNINAFTQPAAGTFGTSSGRVPNLFGPIQLNENMSVQKEFAIFERLNFILRFEAFNIFNRVLPGGLNTDITNPAAFGTFNGQENGPRTAQITAKLNF
ncbi:MAG: Plug and carboxypeptidase regulatory-like domain-containing protein [Acidobacteriota bacterium]|nr:Plug and carboxypeptidase regulatory-like domain-containing protein [Acidobacteriota bacterium]